MRPTSLRHRAGSRRITSPIRQAATFAAAVGAACLLVSSCDAAKPRQASVDRLDAAAASPAPAASPASFTPANEGGRGIMGGAVNAAAPVSQTAATKALADESPSGATTAATGPVIPHSAAAAQSNASAMIIRTGTAGIEVDSLDSAIARVRTLALRVNGYVANTTVQGGRDQLRSASLELKIPAERFDDALAGLSPIGKVESVNVNAEDVGEEYVDIQARVENAHRLEARIIDLLANRTGKLQDVLSVEHELARVREEIERYEGRMRYLRSRSAMSTLTIAVHEHAPVIVPVAGDGPMVVAFRQAWSNFVGVVAGFVASLGVLIPLGVLAFLAFLGIKRFIPWRPSGGTPPAAGAVQGD